MGGTKIEKGLKKKKKRQNSNNNNCKGVFKGVTAAFAKIGLWTMQNQP